MWGEWNLSRYTRWTASEQKDAEDLLAKGGLRFESPPPDLLIIARDGGGRPIGSGALAGNVIKQLVVDDENRGTGLFAGIVSLLLEEAAARGRHHVFAYTQPPSAVFIAGLGFSEVARTSRVVLLETGGPGIGSWLSRLEEERGPGGTAAAIVVNCNPFSLGHLYLVESAAGEVDQVHVFVVSEDRSLFPTPVRLRLVREGLAHLPAVRVHEGGPYIISGATFPNYFLRSPGEAAEVQAELDATIFAGRIAPRLGITHRFLGEEPLDPTTETYNRALLEVLPRHGIAVRIIPRREREGKPISASAIRRAIREGNWDQVRNLAPPVTLAFLRSPEAEPIIEKIRGSDSPH